MIKLTEKNVVDFVKHITIKINNINFKDAKNEVNKLFGKTKLQDYGNGISFEKNYETIAWYNKISNRLTHRKSKSIHY